MSSAAGSVALTQIASGEAARYNSYCHSMRSNVACGDTAIRRRCIEHCSLLSVCENTGLIAMYMIPLHLEPSTVAVEYVLHDSLPCTLTMPSMSADAGYKRQSRRAIKRSHKVGYKHIPLIPS